MQHLYSPLSPVFLFPVDWKVTEKSPFLHHLLDSVISRPTPETSLAGPDPDSCPEGAGESGISPSPACHAIYGHILFRTLSTSIARHLAICLSGRR